MGNQHEVRQTEPFRVEAGAAIPVKAGHYEALLRKEEELHDYRMLLEESEGLLEFPNLDQQATRLERAGQFLCIQSGAKMWCGYRAFIAKLEQLSPHLEDAVFYIADEEDFVDRFSIKGGALQYKRVHSGGWYPLDDFPETRPPRT